MKKTLKNKKKNIVKLPERKTVHSFLDEKADVLYVSFGKPRASETLDTGEDFLIRFDSDSGEITGFTILNFSTATRDIEEQIKAKPS